MAARLLLGAILVAYLLLAAQYVSVTPYRTEGFLLKQRNPDGTSRRVPDVGAPDERQHANYVQHLMDGKGFPVLQPGDYEGYQAHQPPLYYLLGAAWSKIGGIEPIDPVAGRGLRWLSVALGVGTILGTYFAVLWGLGRTEPALAAAAFAALVPMHVALNAAASNDPLLFCVASWTLALCARALARGIEPLTMVLLGILLGLGLVTKTTALALFPTALTALYFCWRRHRTEDPAKRVPYGLLITPIVIGVIMASPWLARNVRLYGDPFAIDAFNKAFTGSPQADMFIGQFGMSGYMMNWVGWWTARSFVGAFGYMDLFLADDVYRMLLAALGVLAIGWVFSLTRPIHKDPPHSIGFHWTAGVLLLVVFALFIRFNLTYFQGQARYLYPAVAVFAAGFGIGLCRLLGRHERFAAPMLALALVALNVWILDFLDKQFTLVAP